jgi:hypothetical protein
MSPFVSAHFKARGRTTSAERARHEVQRDKRRQPFACFSNEEENETGPRLGSRGEAKSGAQRIVKIEPRAKMYTPSSPSRRGGGWLGLRPQAAALISGSPPMRRANCRMRDWSRSPARGARSAGKARITRPFSQTIGARGSTPGIAAEML